MKLFPAFCLSLCLVSSASAQGTVGSLIYQTARFGGRAVPIFDVDPLDPTYVVRGDNLALYARREPVLGDAYWAELWVGPQRATEAGLAPVAGTKVHFRQDVAAIRGTDNLRIPGTLGGDILTVQLRVWAASLNGAAIDTWEQVLANDGVARGTSEMAEMTMGNVSADGHLFIPQLLGFAIRGFGLHTVPEPGLLPLGALMAAGFCRLRRPRRSPASPKH